MRDPLRHRPFGPALAIATLCVLALSGCNQPPRLQGQARPHLADAALTAGYPDMALSVADNILVSDPRNVAALDARGDALYALGRSADAADAYRKALAVNASDAGANAGLGRITLKSDPKAAEPLLRAALRARPDDAPLLSNLAVCMDLQQRHTEAQALYRRSLSISPDVAATKANLGLSLALSGDNAGAQAMLGPLAAQPGATQLVRDNLTVAQMLSVNPPPPTAQTPTAQAPTAQAAAAPAPTSLTPAAAYVQLAAADSEAVAKAIWQRVRKTAAPLLNRVEPQIVPSEVNGRGFWRLRVPAASHAEANRLCDRLHAKGAQCWVTSGD